MINSPGPGLGNDDAIANLPGNEPFVVGDDEREGTGKTRRADRFSASARANTAGRGLV